MTLPFVGSTSIKRTLHASLHSQDHIDIAKISLDLANSIGKAMDSMHRMQAASIDAQGGNDKVDAEPFREICNAMKTHWSGVVDLLRACHGFGRSVVHLRTHLAYPQRQEIVDHLYEMRGKSASIIESANNSVQEHELVVDMYRRYHNRFSEQICASKAPSRLIRKYSYSVSDVEEYAEKKLSRNCKTQTLFHKGGGKYGTRTVFPDGRRAMNEFEYAMEAISRGLQDLVQFVEEQRETCGQCLEYCRGNQTLTLGEVEALAEVWQIYSAGLRRSIRNIHVACDQVLLDSEQGLRNENLVSTVTNILQAGQDIVRTRPYLNLLPIAFVVIYFYI